LHAASAVTFDGAQEQQEDEEGQEGHEAPELAEKAHRDLHGSRAIAASTTSSALLVPAAFFFLCPGQVAQRSRDQVNGR